MTFELIEIIAFFLAVYWFYRWVSRDALKR